MPSADPGAGALSELAARHRLGPQAQAQLALLSRLLVSDPLAPTAIRDPRAVLEDHLADSLVALECESVRSASEVLDLGSGAGLPGLPLAIALPGTNFTLLESSSRKCDFLNRAVKQCDLGNTKVVHDRAESFAVGHGRYDLVTVRAVASPAVNAEYAAPLLRIGGRLLLWRGRRDTQTEAALGVAASELGLAELEIHPVEPYRGARHRNLYLLKKVSDTPPRFPRRPGIALKRPLGAEIAREPRSV